MPRCLKGTRQLNKIEARLFAEIPASSHLVFRSYANFRGSSERIVPARANRSVDTFAEEDRLISFNYGIGEMVDLARSSYLVDEVTISGLADPTEILRECSAARDNVDVLVSSLRDASPDLVVLLWLSGYSPGYAPAIEAAYYPEALFELASIFWTGWDEPSEYL